MLHHAIDETDKYAINLLLEKGAHIFISDDDGRTPIDLIISSPLYSVDFLKIVIDNIDNINIQDENGNTILMKIIHSASWKEKDRDFEKLIDLLLKAGADIDTIENKDGYTAFTLTKHYLKKNNLEELEGQTELKHLKHKLMDSSSKYKNIEEDMNKRKNFFKKILIILNKI